MTKRFLKFNCMSFWLCFWPSYVLLIFIGLSLIRRRKNNDRIFWNGRIVFRYFSGLVSWNTIIIVNVNLRYNSCYIVFPIHTYIIFVDPFPCLKCNSYPSGHLLLGTTTVVVLGVTSRSRGEDDPVPSIVNCLK